MPLEDYRRQVWNCYRCSSGEYVSLWEMKSKRFSKICPSVTRFLWDIYACHGKMDCARALIDGKLQWNDTLIDAIYKCTLCAACDVRCKRAGVINVLEVLEELRAKCVEDGFLKIPAHRKTLESLKRYGNPFGVAERQQRIVWAQELEFNVKIMPKEKAPVLLYVGSMYALEPIVRETIKSIARVLKMAEVNFGLIENEIDDGLYALQLGERGLFEEIAEKNIKIFNDLGIQTLITPDPHAYNAFKRYYPKIGKIEAKVLHVTEYLQELIECGKIKLKASFNGLTITYHDPCNLGRVCGLYEPPRKIIESLRGVEFNEMERIKNNAWCCGAGGGVMAAYPEFMAWTANERIEEAESTGSSILVTSCPWCEYTFKTAVEAKKSHLGVYNIIELLEKACG
ncbi:MAG: (Fe-S)-binding protein [Candidatus Bathyarchaeia archaeon]